MEPIPLIRMAASVPGCPEDATDCKPGTCPSNALVIFDTCLFSIALLLTVLTDPVMFVRLAVP